MSRFEPHTSPSASDDDEDDHEAAERMPLLSRKQTSAEIVESGGNDVVQFSAPIYYASEYDGFVQVEVIRLGTMKGRVAAKCVSKDGSAKASQGDYEGLSQTVKFEEGEHTKRIDIKLLDSTEGVWNPTLEFKLSLSTPQNCDLGAYLHACRVKIFNDDYFPSDAYEDQIALGEEGIREIGSWSLFWEYCKLNYSSSNRKWQTMSIIVIDQVSNVALFISLWVGVYIVDTIFARNAHPGHLLMPDRYHTAMLVGMWFVVPFFLFFAWDYAKAYIDIQGASVRFLQVSIVQAYLDYTKGSRLQVTPQDIKHATNECAFTIASGFVAVLDIIRLLGKIITILIFIMIFFQDPWAIAGAFTVIGALMVIAVTRTSVMQKAQERADKKLIMMDMLVDEASMKYALVHGYHKRPVFNDMFSGAVRSYALERVPVAVAQISTLYITLILTGFFVCVYITVKTPAVLSDELSLGVFLATISIFTTTIAEAMTELNKQFLLIVQTFAPLKEFTTYMNLPSDLPEYKKKVQERREHTYKQRLTLQKESGSEQHPESSDDESKLEAFKSDRIKIEIKNLSFEYIKGLPVLQDVNFAVKQGQLIGVVGPQRSGKDTFVQLLSHSLSPTKGSILMPSHLSVLHVFHEPMFFRATLFSNLCIGLPAREPVDLDRIYAILQICGMPEGVQLIKQELARLGDQDPSGLKQALSPRAMDSMISKLGQFNDGTIRFDDESEPRSSWQESLSHSQKIKLYIACALISNPNILIISHTLESLHKEVAVEMLDVFRHHVDNRGVCQPEESIHSRRPRTVFYSTKTVELEAKADTILKVNPETKNITIAEDHNVPYASSDEGSGRSPRRPTA